MENKKRAAGSHASSSHDKNKGTMTHKEAGHLGGAAHHKCRGRECDKSHHAKATHSEGSAHGKAKHEGNND